LIQTTFLLEFGVGYDLEHNGNATTRFKTKLQKNVTIKIWHTFVTFILSMEFENLSTMLLHTAYKQTQK